MESVSDKLVQAERHKQQGNQYFQQKEYKKALGRYHQAILYLTGLQEQGTAYYSYSKELQLGQEDAKKARDLKLSVYLNMAQIYLFEEKYAKAVNILKKAEQISEPPKLLYRRAIALMHLEQFDRARRDFNRVLEVQPDMQKDIEQRLKQLRNLQRESQRKLSGQFKKMFL